MDKYTFGNKLYKLRTESNLTQKDLANILGVSDKAVSKWETGEAMPRVKTLKNIADCFSVTYEDLLSQTEELKTNETEKHEAYESFFHKRVVKVKKDIKEHSIAFLCATILIFCLRIAIGFQALFVGNGFYFGSLFFGALLPITLGMVFGILLLFFLKKELLNSQRNISVLFVLSFLSVISQIVFFLTETEIDLFVVLSTLIVACSFIVVFVILNLSKKRKIYIEIKRIVTNTGLILVVVFALYLTRVLSFPEIGNLIQIAFVNYFSLFILSETIEYKNLLSVKIQEENQKKEKTVKKLIWTLVVAFSIFILLVTSFPGIIVKYQVSKLSTANETGVLFNDVNVSFDGLSNNRYTFDKLSFSLPQDYITLDDNDGTNTDETFGFTKAGYEKGVLYVKKHKEDLSQVTALLFDGEDEEQLKQYFIDIFGMYPKNDLEYNALMYSIKAEDINIFDYKECIIYAVLIFGRDISTFNGNYDMEFYTTDEMSVEIQKMKRIFFNGSEVEYIDGDYQAINMNVVLNSEEGYYQIVYFPDREEQIDEEFVYKLLNSIEKAE